ncbi:hypothetical protein HPB47_007275 [Ixodes persulcatus]|uniref:Uncharacterized protein n=1 Tax=Ixodes persulcatus TaxID=34615 RepID=A0AC60P833_IXOPE|nr:hypothetical protein HPB47_007275 [Ixodes persulcatus]
MADRKSASQSGKAGGVAAIYERRLQPDNRQADCLAATRSDLNNTPELNFLPPPKWFNLNGLDLVIFNSQISGSTDPMERTKSCHNRSVESYKSRRTLTEARYVISFNSMVRMRGEVDQSAEALVGLSRSSSGHFERPTDRLGLWSRAGRWVAPEMRVHLPLVDSERPHQQHYLKQRQVALRLHPRSQPPSLASTATNRTSQRSALKKSSRKLRKELPGSIKKQADWDGNEVVGYCDLAHGILKDDCIAHAKHALVFLAVAVNRNWKLPLGYALIDGLDGTVQSNLVQQYLIKLKEAGADCIFVTCDGISCNLSMLIALGVSLARVSAILDAYHMLKLMRNLLAEKELIKDGAGKTVAWQYIMCLDQQKEGLHEKQIPGFAGVEAIAEFAAVVDNTLELTNSCHPLALGSKDPIRVNNNETTLTRIDKAIALPRRPQGCHGQTPGPRVSESGRLTFAIML